MCITSAVCDSIVVGLLHVATDYQVLRLVACVPGAEGGVGGGGGGGRRLQRFGCTLHIYDLRY